MKQIRWLGHAGFKISISDPVEKEEMRNIYIDTWLQNPLIPEDLKEGVVPNDADLVLVTHGHFDHSGSAPDLVKASKNPNCKIVCNFEVGNYF